MWTVCYGLSYHHMVIGDWGPKCQNLHHHHKMHKVNHFWKNDVCIMHMYLYLPVWVFYFVFLVLQTACRQSQACLVQMGSLVTVQSVEIKPQGNTMEPPAVTAAKASSDARYARATSIPAGTVCKDTLCKHEMHNVCMHVGNIRNSSCNCHKYHHKCAFIRMHP